MKAWKERLKKVFIKIVMKASIILYSAKSKLLRPLSNLRTCMSSYVETNLSVTTCIPRYFYFTLFQGDTRRGRVQNPTLSHDTKPLQQLNQVYRPNIPILSNSFVIKRTKNSFDKYFWITFNTSYSIL